MSELLRQYDESECNWEGYPRPWAHETPVIEWAGPKVAGSYETVMVPAIKDLIREQAGHRCLRCGHPYRRGEHGSGEWTPCDMECTHVGPMRFDGIEGHGTTVWNPSHWLKKRVVVEAQWRILTVHHLDEDKGNCRWWNLASLCQRCHLRMQRAVVMGRPYHYEHSAWFRPFAAGFYAWKYLNEDLSREEVNERLDDLLSLEHRFTQEALNLEGGE